MKHFLLSFFFFLAFSPLLAQQYVGIGTSSPDHKLMISGNSGPQLRVYQPGAGIGAVAGIRFNTPGGWDVQLRTNQDNSWLELTNNTGVAYQRWYQNTYYPGNSSAYITNGVGGQHIIFGNGNVGIGTISPLSRLHILQSNDAGSGGLALANTGITMSTQLYTGSSNESILNGSNTTITLLSSNIGIMRSNPKGTLDVAGDIYGLNEFTFPASEEAANAWVSSNISTIPTVNDYPTGSWYIEKSAAGWDGGIQSVRTFRRTPGLTLEYEAFLNPSLNSVAGVHFMIGFIDANSTSFSYNQTPSNFMYHDFNTLHVYENSADQGNDYSFDTRNGWYKFRIVLKATGADYYVFHNNVWRLVKSTGYNSVKNVKVAIAAYYQRIYIRYMKVYQSNFDNRMNGQGNGGLRMVQVMNNSASPNCNPTFGSGFLLHSAGFHTTGGPIMAHCSGSAYRADAGRMEIGIYIDGIYRGSIFGFTNEAYSHKQLIPNPLVLSGISPGSHVLQYKSVQGGAYGSQIYTDVNDTYNATIYELPN